MTENQKLPIRICSFKQVAELTRKYSGDSVNTDVLGNSRHWNCRVENKGSLRIFLCRA